MNKEQIQNMLETLRRLRGKALWVRLVPKAEKCCKTIQLRPELPAIIVQFIDDWEQATRCLCDIEDRATVNKDLAEMQQCIAEDIRKYREELCPHALREATEKWRNNQATMHDLRQLLESWLKNYFAETDRMCEGEL